MGTFWLLLIVVVLFVVGSASALNYFTGRPGKGPEPKKNDPEKK